MATDRLIATISPDFSELLDYCYGAIDRLSDHIQDPRVRLILSEFLPATQELIDGHVTDPDAFVRVSRDRGIILEPGDKFLLFVARLRAIERVVL